MNEIQIFSNPEFGEIRTTTINDAPWIVGRDVALILGYAKPENALAAHVDEEDKTTTLIQGTGSKYKSKAVVINESGLYSLILSSKLPGAKKFKHWVTSEVLPAIRKNGGYFSGQEEMSDSEIMAKALMVAQRTIDSKNAQIEEMRPKVLFADGVASSDTSILIREMSKLIRQNGVEMGEKRLFIWLRENGFLIKCRGSDYNMPTQRSMEMGLFEIKETVISGNGRTFVSRTPKITGKGQVYFLNKIINSMKEK